MEQDLQFVSIVQNHGQSCMLTIEPSGADYVIVSLSQLSTTAPAHLDISLHAFEIETDSLLVEVSAQVISTNQVTSKGNPNGEPCGLLNKIS